MDKNSRKIKLEAELKRIVEILCAKYFPEVLILFGSLAKGKIKENSDIDLVIVKQTGKKFTERIGEVISLCKPKMAIDFIVYTPEEFSDIRQKEPFVQKEIIEKGKLLYEKQH